MKLTFFLAACIICSLHLKVKQCLFHTNILSTAEQFLPRQAPRTKAFSPTSHTEASSLGVGKRLEEDSAGTAASTD